MGSWETTSPVVEEEIQKDVRTRLKLARESVRMTQVDVEIVSSGTIRRFEEEDISTLKIGTLLAIGQKYGMAPKEFLCYLFDIGNTLDILDPARQYLNSLPEDLKPLATDVLKAVSDHALQQKIDKR